MNMIGNINALMHIHQPHIYYLKIVNIHVLDFTHELVSDGFSSSYYQVSIGECKKNFT